MPGVLSEQGKVLVGHLHIRDGQAGQAHFVLRNLIAMFRRRRGQERNTETANGGSAESRLRAHRAISTSPPT